MSTFGDFFKVTTYVLSINTLATISIANSIALATVSRIVAQ
jgi:hypothetical protein